MDNTKDNKAILAHVNTAVKADCLRAAIYDVVWHLGRGETIASLKRSRSFLFEAESDKSKSR